MGKVDPPSDPSSEGNEHIYDPNVQILACRRTGMCWGLRWAFRPDLGFPLKWELTYRRLNPDNTPKLGKYWVTNDWITLPDSDSTDHFHASIEKRRAVIGPYFNSNDIKKLVDLRLLVRLADPRTNPNELEALTLYAADFFGDPHQHDNQLLVQLWWQQSPPPLSALLGHPVQKRLLVEFYKNWATEFLLTLASRFEFAVMLGLATDHQRYDANNIFYNLIGYWGLESQIDRSRWTGIYAPRENCFPASPDWLHLNHEPATVIHAAFRHWSGWTPPDALWPKTPDGEPMPVESLFPRSPTTGTSLNWTAEPHNEEQLIDYGAMLYKIARYAHGSASALADSPPAQPAASAFAPLVEGEYVQRSDAEPHYSDIPGMTGQPFEGYYHYEIRGVDLFGNESDQATYAAIRHRHEIPPPSPRVRSGTETVLTFTGYPATVEVPLIIDWDTAEDFDGPNAAEFRIAIQWTPLEAIPVEITGVTNLDTLHAEVHVRHLTGIRNDQYAGCRLSLPGVEHPIVSHTIGSNAILKVYKVNSQLPPNNANGLILAAGASSQPMRVKKIVRRKAIPAIVSKVASLDPLQISLEGVDGLPLPDDKCLRLYFHLFRTTVTAERQDSSWQIVRPQDAAGELRQLWLELADPTAALLGSPAIIFPPHETAVSVQPPPGFSAGMLTVAVTAADAAPYVDSPALSAIDPTLAALKGNESASAEELFSVRQQGKSQAGPDIPAQDENKRLWASSAANYAEFAEVELRWSKGTDAVRYEVWRALEGAVKDVTRHTTDADFRKLARQQHDAWLQTLTSGVPDTDRRGNPFQLRSNQIFGGDFIDRLPGRAPTRALYRIRSIDVAGNMSSFSDLIGPVYVPDVRQPLTPNLLRVVAASPTEAERAVVVEWTQPGPQDDLRFDIFFRPANADPEAQFTLVGSLPRDTLPAAGGRYRFVHRTEPRGLPPGKNYAYYVVAVREALDPIDPDAQMRRDIASSPSKQQVAFAIATTPLAPPQAVSATYDENTGQVTVTWTNQDDYEAIEVRRKAAERYGFRRVAMLSGGAEEFVDQGFDSGEWQYQIRACGINRKAISDIAEVTIP